MSASSKEGLLAVCSTLTGLSITFVGLRFYARKTQKLPLMADDWIVIPAVITYVAAAICNFISVHDRTLGYSSKDFTPAQTASMAKREQQLDFAIVFLMSCTLAFTKMSALFFYKRIFCVGHRMQVFNLTIIVSIVLASCWLITFEFLAGFQCGTHFSALWDGTYAQYCFLSFPYLYGLAISDFLLDIWILALPIPIIMRLHTNRTRKLSIISVFLLAFVGLGASIARMVLFIEVETGGPSYLFSDIERVDTRTQYLSMLEAGISLVAVNLPSLWLLFTIAIPETIIRSMRSVLSLRWSQHSDLEVARAPAGTSTTRLNRKPEASSSTDSGRPVLLSDPSQARSQSRKTGQQLRSDLEDQMYEAYGMHKVESKGSREQAWIP